MIPEELQERVEALVREVAKWPRGVTQTEWEEARAIVAMLPEPVDPMMLIARQGAAQAAYSAVDSDAFLRGEYDSHMPVQSALAALKLAAGK